MERRRKGRGEVGRSACARYVSISGQIPSSTLTSPPPLLLARLSTMRSSIVVGLVRVWQRTFSR